MLIYKGKVIRLNREKKRLPDGRVVYVDVIEHPGAVLIVPFLTARKIILLKQFRPVLGRAIYELPAGTLHFKEAPVVCARRELMEETGFAARRLRLLGSIFPVPGYSTEKIRIYSASGLFKCYRPGDPDEVIQIKVFFRAHVRKLFKSGKIQDAKTIAALVLCGWL